MNSYFESFGFTKTIIKNNKKNDNKLVKWKGNYDGNVGNINLDIIDNGKREMVNMKLDNKDMEQILKIPPQADFLESRLMEDFLNKEPINLQGALINKKSRKRRKKHIKKKKTKRS